MAHLLACPDPRDLRLMALGQLSPAQAEELGRHVLHCADCASRLHSFDAADPLVADLRALGRMSAEPGADALVERILGPRAEATTATNDTPGGLADHEPMPPHLGRYQIVARLGAGGMGVVWRAHDPQLGRDVAIKVPNFRGADEARAESRQRFLREARAAAAVRHANLCPIYDVGEQDGRPFVVMPLVEGESLAGLLRRQGRFLDLREAVQMVLKIAEALACVHAAEIVHRDLKPANILLDRTNVPFLADFGLARSRDSEPLTEAGHFVGTPAYVAPEQANPELGPVGPGSDKYSLGVVFYEMLTGRPPFVGPASALIFQVGTKTVPPPSQHRPDLDTNLEAVLIKALARLPRDRYANVGDFANALRAWQERSAAGTVREAHPAQHRRLTLLSCGCDVFESEIILAALDPEEQHELLVEFQQLCRDAAAPWSGTVVKATDRGLLVCFGIPSALECAARRAVLTGLNLLDRMASLNERLGRQHKGLHLSARIAIHSDRALVTDNSSRGEALSIVGQVASVVDQLEHLAAPDTVVISDDTYRLLRGFVECTSLGTHALKGAAGAKPVYRVHRERAVDCARLDVTGLSGLIPLIGRDRETSLLEERWEQAVEGMGQVVLLVGEAGIGKSRQVHVLKEYINRQHTAGRAALVIEWPCTSLQDAEGHRFHAIASFERMMGLEPHDGPAQKLEKLVAHLDTLQLASAEAIALLASLLVIPLEGRYPALDMSPLRQKEKTFDLLLDWLRAQAQRQPVLLVIEDLHWSGPTNLEFLEILVGQGQGDRLLTLLTFRSEFVPPGKVKGHHTQVSLNRLNRRQTGELMLLKSGLPTIPQNVLDQVADRTDGVPLFVEEFTAMLLEAGSLRVVNGVAELIEDFDMHSIPATLQDLLMARLDRMNSDLDVVQIAAVIGREFTYELLSAVVSCSEETLQQELAKLVDAELLFQHGRPPRARYVFKHALIQDAAYQSLLKKKRQEFHRRIAEALEERFPESRATQPELLAYHFTEGSVIPKAVTYWERAGERAQQRGASADAIRHFARGLELIPTLPETADRHAQEFRLHIDLGLALEWTWGFSAPVVDAHFARAYDLCQRSGEMSQLFMALSGRYRQWQLQAQHDRAQEVAQEMAKLANRQPNVDFVAATHYALGIALFYQGKPVEALSHLKQMLALEPTPELRIAMSRYNVVDTWVISAGYQSWALWLMGYSEQATDQSRQALRMAGDLNHPFSLSGALCMAFWLQQFGKDWEGACATAAQMRTLCADRGIAALVSVADDFHGWAQFGRGQAEHVVSEIRQRLADWLARGITMGRSYHLTLLAVARAWAGEPQEGLKALAEAQQFVEATGERFWEPEIHRLKGELQLQHDPAAAAESEACFHQALTIARQQQARTLELRATLSLARVWDRQGKSQAARELLAPVYSGFTEGFETHDLQIARAFLEHHPSQQT